MRTLALILVWSLVAFLYTHPHKHYDQEVVDALGSDLRRRWSFSAEAPKEAWDWRSTTPWPSASTSSSFGIEKDPNVGEDWKADFLARLRADQARAGAPSDSPEKTASGGASPTPSPSRTAEAKGAATAPGPATGTGGVGAKKACVVVEEDDGFGRVSASTRWIPRSAESMTTCEAKSACRRMGFGACGAVVRDGTGKTGFVPASRLSELVTDAAAKDGHGLVALYGGGGDALRGALSTWDASPTVQIKASHTVDATVAGGWPGPPVFSSNATTRHFASDASTSVAYEVAPLHAELWVDGNRKLTTVDEGLCEGKARCATNAKCAGFIYRVRDGAAVLYGDLRVSTGGGTGAVGARLKKQARKAKSVRRVYRKAADKAGAPRRTACVDASGAVESFPAYDDAGPPASSAAQHAGALRASPTPRFAPPSSFGGGGVSSVDAALRTPRVIVTLTTLPGRIDQIKPVLQSLLAQTVPAYEIQVHAPKESTREKKAYALPDWLRAMPSVTVIRSAKDYGPATKVIPAIRNAQAKAKSGDAALELEDTIYVVVDDDTLYPPRLLETFAEWSARLPDAVVSATGWPVTRTYTYPHWTENYLVYGNELYAPHAVSIIRGNCGFAVKAKFFDETLWTTMAGAPPGATVMDDVWISGHLAKRRVPRFVVPMDGDQFTRTPHFENVVTLDGNLGKGVTDRKQANEAGLRHFKDHWDVFWDPPDQAPRPRAS